jgi:hypothetical protein
MLEIKEMKFIITTEDGKMIAGYNNLKDAETDADDICSDNKDKKFHIYEMKNSVTITDTVLQKTYPLPEPEPEPEPEPKSEPEHEKEKDEEKDKVKKDDKS